MKNLLINLILLAATLRYDEMYNKNMIKTKILCAIIVSCIGLLANAGPSSISCSRELFCHNSTPAMVFHFQSNHKLNSIDCTATLLKFNGNCHLLTNSHCLINDKAENQITIIPEKFPPNKHYSNIINIFPYTNQKHIVKVKTKKVDKLIDLVELYIPKEINNKYCKVIKNQNHKTAIYKDTYEKRKYMLYSPVALGYRFNKSRILYTNDLNSIIDWTTAFFYNYGLSLNLNLLRIHGLEVEPGTSGGVVFSINDVPTGDRFILVGITTRYIPFQYRTFVIPIEEIKSFIKNTNPLVQNSSPIINNLLSPIKYNNKMGGAGDNEHATVKDDDNKLASSGQPFLEPLEGVLERNQPTKIFLGIKITKKFFNSYYEQIDGNDDYFNKYIKGNKKIKKIYRDKDGYPSISLRKNIFKRLENYYHDWINRSEKRNYSPVFSSCTSSIRYKDIDQKYWKRQFLAHHSSTLDIDSRKKKITITLHQPDRLSFEFFYKFSNRYKTITLTSSTDPKLNMICNNNNLLKLRCKTDNTYSSLSISLVNTAKRRIKYLFSFEDISLIGHLLDYNHISSKIKNIVYFSHGELRGVKNASRWR